MYSHFKVCMPYAAPEPSPPPRLLRGHVELHVPRVQVRCAPVQCPRVSTSLFVLIIHLFIIDAIAIMRCGHVVLALLVCEPTTASMIHGYTAVRQSSRHHGVHDARLQSGPLAKVGGGKKVMPAIMPKRAWQVGLSGIVCGIVLQRVALVAPPRLFALHVICMAPMLPLGTAGISTVRQRLSPPPVQLTDAAAKKRRKDWLVIRHFMASAAALYVAGVGLTAIYLHKAALGRAHLRTVHSWLGASAWVVWLGAYLAAQPHVWRDQWRARSFSLLRNKRWQWSSTSHRRLGLYAYALSLLAYCSGIMGWRALPRPTAYAACVAVGAVGATAIGEHGAHELVRAFPKALKRRLRKGRGKMGPPKQDPPQPEQGPPKQD